MRFFNSANNDQQAAAQYGTEREVAEAFRTIASKPYRYRIFYRAELPRGLMFASMDIGMDHPISSPADLAEVMDEVRGAHPDNARAQLAGWSRYDSIAPEEYGS